MRYSSSVAISLMALGGMSVASGNFQKWGRRWKRRPILPNIEPDPVEPVPVEPEPVEPDAIEPDPVEPNLRWKRRPDYPQLDEACLEEQAKCDGWGGKIKFCRHNGHGIPRTLCLQKDLAKLYERQRPADYCGACIEDLFIQNSVKQQLPPIIGNEAVSASDGTLYQATYDVAFREDGIVSLASSLDAINAVTCSSTTRSINVNFKHSISSTALSDMFPLNALLVVDGNVFGDCNLQLEGGEDEEGNIEDGFLVIESVEASGEAVTVRGTPVSFNFMFEHKHLSYTRSQHIRSRKALEVLNSWDEEFPQEDSPLKIKMICSMNAHVHVETLRNSFSLFDGWSLNPHVDIAVKFSWGVGFGVELKLDAKVSEELWKYNKSVPWIGYPIYGVPIPKALRTVIENFLPQSIPLKAELGVYIDVPFVLDADLQFDASMSASAKASFGTGEKAANFILGEDWDPKLTMVKDENADPSGLNFTPPQNTPTSSLTFDGFAGLQPAVALKILGVGEASIGFKGGLEFNSKLQFDPPLDPIFDEPSDFPLEFYCDDCHALEMDLGIKVGDPFFRYKVGLLTKTSKTLPIGDFQRRTPLAKVCLIDHPTSTLCGELCCSAEETCIQQPPAPAFCCNPADSAVECCKAEDCGDPGSFQCTASNKCESIVPPCSTDDPGVDCCEAQDCFSGPDRFFTCTALNKCEAIPCSLDQPGVQCCTDEDCNNDVNSFKCDMRSCMPVDKTQEPIAVEQPVVPANVSSTCENQTSEVLPVVCLSDDGKLSGTCRTAAECDGESINGAPVASDDCNGMSDDRLVCCIPEELLKASGWGDPHIVTFDGLKYECHAEGEVILSSSLDSDFEIQARFTKVNFPTVTTGVVVRERNDLPLVQLSMATTKAFSRKLFGGCPVDLYVDGSLKTLTNGTGIDTVGVTATRDMIKVFYPSTRTRMSLQVNRFFGVCYFSVNYYLPAAGPLREEQIVGILGSPNGNIDDDWMTSTGDTLSVSGKWAEAYEYCSTQWCMRNSLRSLFTYEPGKAFEDFENCDGVYDSSIDTKVENAKQCYRDICGDDVECLIDAVILGSGAAQEYLQGNFVDSKTCTPSPTKDCYFSCSDALLTTCSAESGLYEICPGGTAQYTVYCDQRTSGGGWMLTYSYNHSAGENAELVRAIPQDPEDGYSHSHVMDFPGYSAQDIETVRFYCTSSSNDRTVHFSTRNALIRGMAFDGNQIPNHPTLWKDDCETFELNGHSGMIPGVTDNCVGDMLSTPDGGFLRFPFYRCGKHHWSIGAIHLGGVSRWECDDSQYYNGGIYTNTLHNVWVRIKPDG